jgi:hypothetical protein
MGMGVDFGGMDAALPLRRDPQTPASTRVSIENMTGPHFMPEVNQDHEDLQHMRLTFSNVSTDQYMSPL